MNPDNVKDCMRCNKSLEQGYSSRWVDNICKEVICFKCNKSERLTEYLKDKRITSGFMLDNMMDVYDLVGGSHNTHDVQYLTDFLSKVNDETVKAKVECQLYVAKACEKIKEFERKVWFTGLQDKILATKTRGVSASHGTFKVLTWSGMGRTMITIQDGNTNVSCVADETSKEGRTGLQSMNATGEQALALIDMAISLYENGTLTFKDDEKVSII